jgi:hypothetical protein
MIASDQSSQVMPYLSETLAYTSGPIVPSVSASASSRKNPSKREYASRRYGATDSGVATGSASGETGVATCTSVSAGTFSRRALA